MQIDNIKPAIKRTMVPPSHMDTEGTPPAKRCRRGEHCYIENVPIIMRPPWHVFLSSMSESSILAFDAASWYWEFSGVDPRWPTDVMLVRLWFDLSDSRQQKDALDAIVDQVHILTGVRLDVCEVLRLSSSLDDDGKLGDLLRYVDATTK